MAEKMIRIYADVNIDTDVDHEDVASAIDALVETALSVPDILGSLDGKITIGAFYIENDKD